MSQTSQRLPEWVTALEAAVLTGTSEGSILEAARTGAIGSAPLKMGRAGSGVLMVRLLDAQGLAAVPVAAPAPVVPPAAPVAAAPAAPVAAPAPVVAPAAPVAAAPAAPVAAPAPVVPPAAPVAAPPTPAARPSADPGALPAETRTETPPTPWASSSSVWSERPSDWRSIEVPAHPQRSTVRERLRDPKALAVVLIAVVLLATAIIVIRPHHTASTADRSPVVFGVSPRSVVWSVGTSKGTLVAVVGAPAGHAPTVMAVPGDTVVTLPAGDQSTVGQSAGTGPVAQAVVQGLILRRVGHYLAGTVSSLSTLIDHMGGIDVVTEAAFTFGGHRIGAGNAHFTGASAAAYLSQASADDLTGRWEDVLTGVFGTSATPSEWSGIGASDDGAAVGQLMAAAKNGPVLELPTAPGDGGMTVDRDGLTHMLDTKFGASIGTLIRIVVVNGSGTPGLGTLIDGKLAPYGYSVVASQNARRFNISQTSIVASGNGFMTAAERARAVLGMGKVRVSDQPTDVADLTIVVGKDISRRH